MQLFRVVISVITCRGGMFGNGGGAAAQMFMDNGSDIPSLERTACVTYDQRSVESQEAQEVRYAL